VIDAWIIDSAAFMGKDAETDFVFVSFGFSLNHDSTT